MLAMTEPTGDLLTFEEAAAILKRSPRQLYRWRKAGKFETVDGVVEAVTRQPATLIPRSEVERLQQEEGLSPEHTEG